MNFLKITVVILVLMTTSCSHANTPLQSSEVKNDSIDIEAEYSFVGDSIRITLISKSKDKTHFLFSSYLKPLYSKSKYLFRYDSKIESFKYSLLPIVNYLNTVPTDKRIISDEALFNEHQVVYEFKEIQPDKQISFTLHKNLLCGEKSMEQVIMDFNTNEIEWAEIQKEDKDGIEFGNEITLEFAIYTSIDVLQDKGGEYRNPEGFKKKAKQYERVNLTLICQ